MAVVPCVRPSGWSLADHWFTLAVHSFFETKPASPKLTAVALQVDAGYIRAVPHLVGAGWIAARVSKLAVPQTTHSHAQAHVTGYNLHQD